MENVNELFGQPNRSEPTRSRCFLARHQRSHHPSPPGITAVYPVGQEGNQGRNMDFLLIHCYSSLVSESLGASVFQNERALSVLSDSQPPPRLPRVRAAKKAEWPLWLQLQKLSRLRLDPWGYVYSSQQILLPEGCQREGVQQELHPAPWTQRRDQPGKLTQMNFS